MSDLAEMRKQLRELRKGSIKPVSRMRKGDISAEIEKLRTVREETPAAAAVPSTKSRKMAPAVVSVKEAKAAEFPVKPTAASVKAAKPAAAAAGGGAKKKESRMDRMMRMIEEMSDTDEE